jgi:hypothetical protein
LSSPNFEKILDTKYINHNDSSNSDILDGISARKNRMEMKSKFDELDLDNKGYISICLLCGMFYDGLQIYKSKVTNFWPLYITILNLPPSFRTTNHAGVFLSSIFTSNIYIKIKYILYNNSS